MKHKLETRLLGEKYQQPHDITLMAESEEEIKSQEITVKEESEKADLKLNVGKTKIIASGPITSWQMEGEKVEAVTDFIFLGSKITVDGNTTMKLKDACSLEKKNYDNPGQHIKKQRHLFANKSPI